jgi:hypothetical protein
MLIKIDRYKLRGINQQKILESYQGWQAYAKWANSYRLRNRIISFISNVYLPEKIKNKDFID